MLRNLSLSTSTPLLCTRRIVPAAEEGREQPRRSAVEVGVGDFTEQLLPLWLRGACLPGRAETRLDTDGKARCLGAGLAVPEGRLQPRAQPCARVGRQIRSGPGPVPECSPVILGSLWVSAMGGVCLSPPSVLTAVCKSSEEIGHLSDFTSLYSILLVSDSLAPVCVRVLKSLLR